MRTIPKIFGTLAIMMMPLALSPPALAEPSGGSSPTPQAGMMEEQRIERKEFREEMSRLRGEHERLQAERDQLKVQCMNVKGEARGDCQAQWKTLGERGKALQAERKQLRHKMQADRMGDRKEHREVRQERREKHANQRKEHREKKKELMMQYRAVHPPGPRPDVAPVSAPAPDTSSAAE